MKLLYKKIIGIAFIAVGIIMLILPFLPGFIFIALGLVFLFDKRKKEKFYLILKRIFGRMM
ncbi:MAG: hypothetical protein Q7R61_00990 [bacterium]|nr:hypothetical protein [bacterium]